MPLPQQKFRELVFQLLYSQDLGKPQEEDIVPLLMQQLSITKKTARKGLDRVKEIGKKIEEIDQVIANTSHSYAFERIQSVERNVLRLGVFEILYDPAIPPKVAIHEALRLAKKFGTKESAAFVNAILDHIYKKKEGLKADVQEIEITAQALMESEKLPENVEMQTDEE